jgi:hypothetical protein
MRPTVATYDIRATDWNDLGVSVDDDPLRSVVERGVETSCVHDSEIGDRHPSEDILGNRWWANEDRRRTRDLGSTNAGMLCCRRRSQEDIAVAK